MFYDRCFFLLFLLSEHVGTIFMRFFKVFFFSALVDPISELTPLRREAREGRCLLQWRRGPPERLGTPYPAQKTTRISKLYNYFYFLFLLLLFPSLFLLILTHSYSSSSSYLHLLFFLLLLLFLLLIPISSSFSSSYPSTSSSSSL